MNVYTVIKEFAAPVLGVRLHISDTVGRVTSRAASIVDGIEYDNLAFYQWIVSLDGANYLLFAGTIPDPVPPGVPNVKAGSQDISIGEDAITIAGMGWGFVPSSIVVTVNKPDGGDNLFAIIRSSSVTQDGFIIDLSAPASSAGYSITFIAME